MGFVAHAHGASAGPNFFLTKFGVGFFFALGLERRRDKVLDVLAIELRDELLREQKMSELGLTEDDISDAVAWARSDK